MSMLKIVINPNPLLREIAEEVDLKAVGTKDFNKFLDSMMETMLAKDGVGLAAPQVNESIRVIVVNTKSGPLAMINPEIVKKSVSKDWDEEGCLSVPHTFGQVKRYRTIVCQFVGRDGQKKKIEAKGFFARIIQHEIDHLDGILYYDRINKDNPFQAIEGAVEIS